MRRPLPSSSSATPSPPIDLIPDFIPVIGYLDDLILVPLGIMLVIRMIPAEVLAECRQKSEAIVGRATRAGKIAAAVIVLIPVESLGGAHPSGPLITRSLHVFTGFPIIAGKTR